MLQKFHNASMYFNLVRITGFCLVMLTLNGCYKVSRGEVFPNHLPDAIVNEPYSTAIYISGGVIRNESGGLHVQANPTISNITFRPIEKKSNNSIFLQADFGKKGHYIINFSGSGFDPNFIKLDHNSSLNVLSQSSVCSYQNTAYDLSKYKGYEQSSNFFHLLPKSTIRKIYQHQIKLLTANTENFYLSKQDVTLTVLPEDSGLKVRPVNKNSYNIVELYGTPKAIGSIVLIVDINKIPNLKITPVRHFILPVFPDQSHCQ